MVDGVPGRVGHQRPHRLAQRQVRARRGRDRLPFPQDVLLKPHGRQHDGRGEQEPERDAGRQPQSGRAHATPFDARVPHDERDRIPRSRERPEVEVLRVAPEPPEPEHGAEARCPARRRPRDHEVSRHQRPRQPDHGDQVKEVQRPVHPERGCEREQPRGPRRQPADAQHPREHVDAERTQEEVEEDKGVVGVEGRQPPHEPRRRVVGGHVAVGGDAHATQQQRVPLRDAAVPEGVAEEAEPGKELRRCVGHHRVVGVEAAGEGTEGRPLGQDVGGHERAAGPDRPRQRHAGDHEIGARACGVEGQAPPSAPAHAAAP